MTINILMPALSPTMESGTLARWLVKEGDHVRSGAVIAEIETDKATMEFEAVDEGTVGRIVVPEGTEGVRVNDLIAVLIEEGENPAAIAQEPERASDPTRADRPGRPEATEAPQGGRIFASPLARRIAAEKSLDLAAIVGSGPQGRIVKADVDGAQRAGGTEAPPAAPSRARPALVDALSSEAVKIAYAGRAFEEIELDGMRRTIAARLSEAKATIPHFYLRRDVHLDALLRLRTELNGQLEPRGVKLSVNDFIIKACALALQQVPDCNAVWAADRILRLKPSDVAVAVAIDGGLFTPVLRDAESKSLSTLSEEMKELAARARARRLAPDEYQGGSFAISNLGMMGVDSFDAVINPPQASILAVGAGVSRPVAGASGQVEVATVMSLTLSVDHRVIDGALGATFLAAIRQNLEAPLAMLA